MVASRSLASVRRAVATSFFVSGAVVSSWVPHIPGIQRALGLQPAQLGLVLLAPAIGLIVAMGVSGGLSARFGTARLMRAATILYCCMIPLTVVAPNPWLLGCVLALLGLGNGALGVAMNAEAVEVEKAYGRGIMSSFHALYSLGCLLGAAAGGFVIAAGGLPVVHLLVVGLGVGALGVGASFRYLPGEADPEAMEQTPLIIKPTRFLALLGAGTFCSMLVEGAMADWAALFMRDCVGATAAFATSGFAAYSLMMVLGRLTGDVTTRVLGPSGTVQAGGVLATLGLALAVGVRQPLTAMLGFGLVGAGLANVVPNFFTAAGRETRLPAARSIAAVSSLGVAGFLTGPPLIGAIAQLASLPVAMGSIMLFSGVIAALAGAVQRDASLPAGA